MSRYDYQGTLDFAQQKIDEARDYREEQIKKQEKFSKRLLMFDTAVRGANALINQRAAELDAKQLPQKAAYQNLLTRSQNFRTAEAERIKSGLSVEDYLENKYFTQLETEAQKDFSYLSPAQYNKALREEASKLAKANLASYNNLIETTKNIPTFEDFTEYYEQQADIPRNLASWIGSKAKGFVRKETEETLKLKNERADDALYGTAMFDKFGELSTALKAYDTVTNQGIDAAKIINRLKLTTGRLVPDMEQKETIKEVDKIKGITTEKIIVSLATMTPDGNIEYRPENKHVIAEVTSRTGEDRVTLTDVNKLLELTKPEEQKNIQAILQTKGDGLPTYKQYEEARKYLTDNPSAYAIDWQDEASKEKAFPSWYSAQIQYVKDPTTGDFISKEVDGVFIIDENYREVAIELGLDEISMREEFNKLGTSASVKPLTKYEVLTQNKKDLMNLVPEENKTNYKDLIENQDSELYDIIGIKISKSDADEDIVSLGVLDLNMLMPNLGLQGSRELFWDKRTQKIIY